MYLQRFRLGKSSSQVEAVLRFMVRSASDNILVYRRLLAETGVDAHAFRGTKDLEQLPVVDKSALLHDVTIDQLLHRRSKPARCVRVHTSGYTGVPIDIYMSWAEAAYRSWNVVRAWRRLAKLPTLFRLADLGTWVGGEPGKRVLNRAGISVLRIAQALPVEQQIDMLRDFVPHVISGPPTMLELLAWGMRDRGIAFDQLRLVASRGEVLFDQVRKELEGTFKCCVGDFYNCEEIGNVATQCPRDPHVFHVNTDTCLVEAVGADGRHLSSGEEGRLLLTSLTNCTMPLIRYEIGDRGTVLGVGERQTCSCGSRHPQMRLSGGRTDDYIYFPDGRCASPRLVGTSIYRVALETSKPEQRGWLFRGFQVVQDAREHLAIRVIPETEDLRDLETRIQRAVKALHSGFRTTVSFVEEIPLEPSGKLKKVIRLVDPPSDDGEVRMTQEFGKSGGHNT